MADDTEIYHVQVPDIDQDTGLSSVRPTDVILQQSLTSRNDGRKSASSSSMLKSYYQLDSNPLYIPRSLQTQNPPLPAKGYFWMFITHPVTKQLTIGRVYTRDPANDEFYIQHYLVASDPIESYSLKNTKQNQNTQGSSKYKCTTDTSAIIKCPGCQLHDDQHLLAANQRARRNVRSAPTCIFKQSADVAYLLPVKSHQLYQDIILLKHHLTDLLPQLHLFTNPLPLQEQPIPDPDTNKLILNRPLDSPLDSNYNISLPSLDLVDQMIDQFIVSPEVSHNLKTIASYLKNDHDIQFYTDGSLQNDTLQPDAMGLSFVVVNQEHLEFSASAVLWPLSTKAEMLACLAALMVVPVQALTTLYTDSAATIAGFNRIDELKNLSVRKREKIPNFQIWLTIAHIMEIKNLTIQLVKVKAHSGERLNERADRLAKTAAFSAPRLHLNYLNLPGNRLELTCDYLTVEASSRRCIKSLYEAKHFFQILHLQRNSDIHLLTEQHHIHWSATSFMLNHNTTAKDKASTSFPQHRQRSFKYKLFCTELPTLSRMRSRRPDLYPVDTCLSCQRCCENQSHFWTCSAHQEQWRDILNSAAELLTKLLQKISSKHLLSPDMITTCLHGSRTFISKGVVSTALFNLVNNIARSESTSSKTIADVYNFIYQQVFALIWKPRCVKVIAYEQTLGISNRDKRSKHRSARYNYPPDPLLPIDTQIKDDLLPRPWVDWYTASIRQGLTWLNYVYTPQADMFRSFITSTINTFTNPIEMNKNRLLVDQFSVVPSFNLV